MLYKSRLSTWGYSDYWGGTSAGSEIEVGWFAVKPRDALTFAAVGVPEPLMAVLRFAFLWFAKLAFAVLMVPEVCGTIVAMPFMVICKCAFSRILTFTNAIIDIPSVWILATLIKEQAVIIVEGPVFAGWAGQRMTIPLAFFPVKPFIGVSEDFILTWVIALAAAGVFIPVLSVSIGMETAFLRRALTSAIACVPVLTKWAIVFALASAFASASVPVLEFRASLLFALAAAIPGVPVKAISAFVRKAAALAVLTILVLVPEESSVAVLNLAFPSAGTGVPVLTSEFIIGWSA